MMVKGIGYLEYCKLRMNEGYSSQQTKDSTGYEEPGQERYVLYFARSHIADFETGVLARGELKIGQAKFLSAVMRSRNQPGNDFRCYAEIVLSSTKETYEAEAIVKKLYKGRRIKLTQNQQELYNLKDEELKNVIEYVVSNLPFKPVEIKYYV